PAGVGAGIGGGRAGLADDTGRGGQPTARVLRAGGVFAAPALRAAAPCAGPGAAARWMAAALPRAGDGAVSPCGGCGPVLAGDEPQRAVLRGAAWRADRRVAGGPEPAQAG